MMISVLKWSTKVSLTLCAINALTVSAYAQANGYKVFDQAAMSIEIADPDASGASQTTMTVIADNAEDCARMTNRVPAMEQVCEKMDKQGLKRLIFSGQGNMIDNRTFEGRVDLPTNDFAINMRLMVQGSRIAVATLENGARPASLLMVGEPGMYDRISNSVGLTPPPSGSGDERVGYRLGSVAVGEVGLSTSNNGQSWNARFKLDAKVDEYGYDLAAADCYRTINDQDYIWIRQCEKASKDGVPFEMSGTLTPVSWRRDAYSGFVQNAQGNWGFNMLVVNPTQRKFDVGLTARDDPGFSGEYTLLEFDTMARPNTPAPSLSANNWRVPQESLSTIGFDMELSLEQAGSAINGDAVLWFRAETDQISGFCPDTSAMRRICERFQKDGPLEMSIALNEKVQNVANGWRGAATPIGWNAGAFELDFFQGSSITDWGDEEPDAYYIRFRSPGVALGSEGVAWVKVEPMNRGRVTMAELDARGTYDRPASNITPPAPPAQNEADACLGFADLMQALQTKGQFAQGNQALIDAGFWGGIVPNEQADCQRAVEALNAAGLVGNGPENNATGQSGSGRITAQIGTAGEALEVVKNAQGAVQITIPNFDRCITARQTVCEQLQGRAGTYQFTKVASSSEHTYGLLLLDNWPHIVRIDHFENGGGHIAISASMEDTLHLNGR